MSAMTDGQTLDLAEGATARACLYSLFCVATAWPEEWQNRWLKRRLVPLSRQIGARLPLPGIAAGLRGLPAELQGMTLPALAVEHGRLDRLAPPYESHYRDPEGLLMGEFTAAVVQSYRDAGVSADENWSDLPDHLWAELEFMAWLTEQEANSWKRESSPLADRWLHHQERFLRDHLLRWVPAYAERVRSLAPAPYYLRMAELLEQVVHLDVQWVQSLRRQVPAVAE